MKNRKRSRTLPSIVTGLLIVAAAVFGTTYLEAPGPGGVDTHIQPPVVVHASEHREMLNALPVKGRAPKTGYEREQFGQAWSDDVRVEFGRNGCDTRNDILHRDLVDVQVRPGTHDCLVESGTLSDPYSGEEIPFVRGRDTSSAVQIDHVVALSDAWQKGAQQLDAETRRDLANDPDNLLAVDGSLNQQKSDSDAASWLPPNRAFRCEYAQKQIVIKERYGLWVTEAERDALARQLETCPA